MLTPSALAQGHWGSLSRGGLQPAPRERSQERPRRTRRWLRQTRLSQSCDPAAGQLTQHIDQHEAEAVPYRVFIHPVTCIL